MKTCMYEREDAQKGEVVLKSESCGKSPLERGVMCKAAKAM